MFYAIEYAYGPDVINNGARADRVVKFSHRRLRDAWVADGNFQRGPGYRETLSARDPLVRKAWHLETADAEALPLVGVAPGKRWADSPSGGEWVSVEE